MESGRTRSLILMTADREIIELYGVNNRAKRRLRRKADRL